MSTTPLPPRWYSVANDGPATLCVDQADAEHTAKESDLAYPTRAPHRAVQLVEAQPAQPAAIAILGPLLFQFDSFAGWVNHAQTAWKRIGVRSDDTVCVDTRGRMCRIGRDFMTARDEGAFPVRVHLMRDDLREYPQYLQPAASEGTPQ